MVVERETTEHRQEQKHGTFGTIFDINNCTHSLQDARKAVCSCGCAYAGRGWVSANGVVIQCPKEF